MRNIGLRRWAAAAIVAAGAVGAVGSGVAVAAADQDRYFEGTADGALTGATSPADLVIDYTGIATHLGRFTRREWLHLNADGTFVGTIVFVASDGDELDADLEGHFTSPTDAVGTYTFTGGTGRFSDATGTADFTAYAPDLAHISISFQGTIDY